MKSNSKHKIGFIIAISFAIILLIDRTQMNNPKTFIPLAIVGLIGTCIGFAMMVGYGIDSVCDDMKDVRLAFYEYKNKPDISGFPPEII